jgi:hypothetical protein
MSWYTYVYLNPMKPSNLHSSGFEPFYVGKGAGDRCLQHLAPSIMEGDCNRHKVNTIKKILREGLEPVIIRNCDIDDEGAAYSEEITLIKLYGRVDLGEGPLTNMTNGGEGRQGIVTSGATRQLLSEKTSKAHAEGKLKTNTLAWISAGLAKAHAPEGRAKSALARTGLQRSDEACANMSFSRKIFIGGLTAEERREKLGTMRGKHHTEASNTKNRANNPRTMRVEVMGVVYPSLNMAVKTTGINKPKLKIHPTFKVLS